MSNPFEVIERRLSAIEDVLQELRVRNQPTFSALSSDELLTVSQVAELLDLTSATVYGMVYEKRIPFSKPGGRLYFSRADLLDWVKNGRRATTEELDEQARQQVATRIDRRNRSKQRKGGSAHV